MGSLQRIVLNIFNFRGMHKTDMLQSLHRAQDAQASGKLAAEICPVTVTTRKGSQQVDKDEQPLLAKPERYLI